MTVQEMQNRAVLTVDDVEWLSVLIHITDRPINQITCDLPPYHF